jgi:hypothetical protein
MVIPVDMGPKPTKRKKSTTRKRLDFVFINIVKTGP